MTLPSLEIENLSKRYRTGHLPGFTLSPLSSWSRTTGPYGFSFSQKWIWALRQVSFKAHPGEILGIVGKNGSGKSTLLKVLSRITAPTEGRAIVRGRVGSLLEVGAGLHPELSGRENIYLSGTFMGLRKREIEGKMDKILALAGIGEGIDTPVKRYSSGMFVRLAFAVAVELEPDILMLDEVLSVGDSAFEIQALDRIRDLSLRGKTILIVSHQDKLLSEVCHRTLTLEKGELVQQVTVN